MTRALRRCQIAAALVATLATAVFADEDAAKFPSRPITIIVNFGPGGPTDVTARKLAAVLEKEFNQAVTVDNRAGGTGVIGFTAIARAKPDGYTLGSFSYSPAVITPHVRTVPYDTLKDFTPVSQYAEYAMTFCANKTTPWKSMKELVAAARQSPGTITYGTVGTGSGQHIAMEALAKKEKIKLTHVPFRGGAETIAGVLGGHVNGALAAELANPARTGDCRPLAVLSGKRPRALPDTPTFAELGYTLEAPLWLGLAGPAGIPRPILKKLEDVIAKSMKDPALTEALEQFFLTSAYRGSDDFRRMIARDYERQRDLITEMGLAKK